MLSLLQLIQQEEGLYYTLQTIWLIKIRMILICIKNNLDLTFIEIASPNKSNIISGCIYRYSKMDQTEFNHYCLNTLSEKMEKKSRKKLFFF